MPTSSIFLAGDFENSLEDKVLLIKHWNVPAFFTSCFSKNFCILVTGVMTEQCLFDFVGMPVHIYLKLHTAISYPCVGRMVRFFVPYFLARFSVMWFCFQPVYKWRSNHADCLTFYTWITTIVIMKINSLHVNCGWWLLLSWPPLRSSHFIPSSYIVYSYAQGH